MPDQKLDVSPSTMLPNTNAPSENDAFLCAFIEGTGNASVVHPEKTANMILKMSQSPSFSIFTLFFGPIYWAYRKCYAPAALLFCACIGAFIIGAPLGFGSICQAPMLVASFMFYPIYHKQATDALAQARMQTSNESEICATMRQCGGTSNLAALIATVIYLTCFTFLVAVMTAAIINHA
ncbi:DUF2628 domain-containing protein [Adlercreutzia murintestinalis]|uniref:DUF2628 domain-containing protein n=1 Tax=Adlercreutzia murintestinalis TaxID=2941325 RepID=UPI00203D0C7C|nr:DUF2628 domain-containing protein [Adlercreutzia murintestinalis]